MKYKTFRNLVFGGVLLIIGWQGYSLYQEDEALRRELSKALPDETVPPVQMPPQGTLQQDAALSSGSSNHELALGGQGSSSGSGSADGALRQLDRDILAQLAQPAASEKVKDAISGPAKVNLYHDDKSGFYNRLKVDLDRDDKWDEKWTIAGGKVLKRQVAPADDEQYSLEFSLEGERWVQQR